jgi:hypothetical protein
MEEIYLTQDNAEAWILSLYVIQDKNVINSSQILNTNMCALKLSALKHFMLSYCGNFNYSLHTIHYVRGTNSCAAM